jgi:hypothetical protein
MDEHGSLLPSSKLLGLQRPLRWGAVGVTSPERAFSLPTGTVTFLLTDIEGSTRLWQSEPADLMRSAILRHYEILAEVVARIPLRPYILWLRIQMAAGELLFGATATEPAHRSGFADSAHDPEL